MNGWKWGDSPVWWACLSPVTGRGPGRIPRRQEVLRLGRWGGDRTTQLPHRRYRGDGLQVLHDLRFLVLLKVAGGEQEGFGVVLVGVRIRRTARTLIGNVPVDWELRSPANDCGLTPVVCGRSTFWMESAVLDAHTVPLCAGTEASSGRRSACLLPEAVADDVACPLAVEELRGASLVPSGF